MKTILLVGVSAAFLGLLPASAFAEDVRVTLTGVEARGGQILASLQTEAEFLQPRGAHSAVVPAPAANGEVVVVFENVAPGAYAFSAMHDANGHYQMQREADGRPLEGWAMHNGASLRAAPTFAQVKIDIGAEDVALTEAMIYPR
jgi:uncharacterized protein (DUF2141 family)